jgi:hypothetical protein
MELNTDTPASTSPNQTPGAQRARAPYRSQFRCDRVGTGSTPSLAAQGR